MTVKSFGVKELNIIGTGTPTIESPGGGNLNLNAATATFSGTVATSQVRQEHSGNPSFVHLGTGGRVGILQASPGSALEVKGGIRSAQTPASGHIDLKHDGSNGSVTTSTGNFLFYNSNNSGSYIFHATSSNTSVLNISSNGTFTGSSTNNISDQRLKENIATITDPITKIKALKGRTFTWKPEALMRSGTHYGFIAQEVESTISDLIVDDTGIRIFDKDDNLLSGDATLPNGGSYAKSVNVNGIVPVLVEALKEAITEIETLKTKVAALEGS